MKSKKILGPDDVASVIVGPTRYEALHWGKSLGFAQNGGHVAAIDVATGHTLWTVELYRIAYDARMEADKQDVFIVELAASADGRALLAIDDTDRRWRLDLATRAVVAGTLP